MGANQLRGRSHVTKKRMKGHKLRAKFNLWYVFAENVPLLMKNLLTSERSEEVPFLRRVRRGKSTGGHLRSETGAG